ncbi:citrulline utilization hydrolase CtlX [Flavitalea flava]
MQTTSHLLMIRPVNFGFNAETAVNNAFQIEAPDDGLQEKALKEFDAFVKVLRENKVEVTVIEDTREPYTPDSLFPNNWVSFHQDGTICLYPMFALNRRLERKPGVLKEIGKKFISLKTIDLSSWEAQGLFLEGTGSMVLDRDNKIAYACLSPRTESRVLQDFCEKMNYIPETFKATDAEGRSIYHTNVMMCVADKYIVICLDSLTVIAERKHVLSTIGNSGKQCIEITLDQMNHFAGNMLQVHNTAHEKLLVMSTRAYDSLTTSQKDLLGSFNRIIHSPLTTIENQGGGSARCMMAEIHLPETEPC